MESKELTLESKLRILNGYLYNLDLALKDSNPNMYKVGSLLSTALWDLSAIRTELYKEAKEEAPSGASNEHFADAYSYLLGPKK